MKKEINTLIFAGGGIKTLAYIGVLKKIEELIIKQELPEQSEQSEQSEQPGQLEPVQEDVVKVETEIIFNIKHISAVSAGSMFGLMYLLGYTSEQMSKEVINKKLNRLKSIKFTNLISNYGIDSGNNIILWIESFITNKGYNKDITLKEFYNLVYLNTGKYINFDIIAANLNTYEYTIFNHLNTPNIKVTDAIRMSISIPFIFTVTKYDIKNCKVGNGHIHVDGGLIENYPIHLFKNNLENVLGLKILTSKELNKGDKEEINSIEKYIYHVLSCFLSQRDRRIIMAEIYKKHTIYIDIKNITSSMNLGLSTVDKKRLIDIGYDAADTYFDEISKI